MIESTTEISSLEGTSPRETASTSAHRVSNTLIAAYGREKKYLVDATLKTGKRSEKNNRTDEEKVTTEATGCGTV